MQHKLSDMPRSQTCLQSAAALASHSRLYHSRQTRGLPLSLFSFPGCCQINTSRRVKESIPPSLWRSHINGTKRSREDEQLEDV